MPSPESSTMHAIAGHSSPSGFTPMTEHHASPSSRRRRTCVTTWDGVRHAKTWPSTGSQLGFSGIWSSTGIWFHDRRQLEDVQPPQRAGAARRKIARSTQPRTRRYQFALQARDPGRTAGSSMRLAGARSPKAGTQRPVPITLFSARPFRRAWWDRNRYCRQPSFLRLGTVERSASH